MATQTDQLPLGPEIQTRLAQLRRRIKTYVWLEGISLALVWLGATFWIGLAIDYLPVLVGASEMPRAARLVLLSIIGIILAVVIYRWIFRRAFIRLPDHSMAVLLERQFGQFHDSLVTAVELAEQPDHADQFSSEMLAHTRREAQDRSADVRVGEVFRYGPIVSKMLMACAMLVPIGLFFLVNSAAATTWANRLYLLADEPWPRGTHLAVAGIQIETVAATDGEVTLSDLIPFGENNELKVAKGTSVVLKVHADATKVIPEYCSVYYETAEGDRGTVTMQKLGRIRRDAKRNLQYQVFVCDSKPFRGILSSVSFDVRGLDHRVRDYQLTVVESPVIFQTQLDCVFPDYMVNEELSLWGPRTIEYASGAQLPMGTHITLRAQTNKDLTKVEIHDTLTDEFTTLDIPQDGNGARQFNYVVEQLQGNLALDVTLYDTDGVVSNPPIRLYIAGIEDQPPVVKANLRGIGTAVTPDVVIPAQGEISDEYDIARSWFDVAINDGETREYPIALGKAGALDGELDFRDLRAEQEGIELKPKDKLSVTLMAADKCDLTNTPNIGSGDRYQLDVVTPQELITMLERRELGLRRRLEQIIDEMSEMRDSVTRLKRPTDNQLGSAPEDERKKEPQDETDSELGKTNAERDASLRLIRTQRSLVQSDKSAQEVLGVAASFADIREELINNRVDSKDRESRLKEQIADPLRLIGETMFPVLNRQLEDVEQKLEDPVASDAAVDGAVEQADVILLELDKVLQKILELETYNELMNIIRSLIEDQDELIDKAKQEQKKRALDLLN